MSERRLSTVLKDLLLACLNATLILVALCLFLSWQVVQSAQGVTDAFAERLIELHPLRDDVQALTAEGQALRGELEALRTAAKTSSTTLSPVVAERISSLETRVEETSQRVEAFLETPEALIFSAIDHAADRATQGVAEVLQCARPET